MVRKRLLCPERERRVPRQFSWVDQRLVLERQFQCCSLPAWGLYLFLVAAGDLQGLSYYSDASVCKLLSLSGAELQQLRHDLCAAGMIAYQYPLYQVLSLPPQAATLDRSKDPKHREAETVADVLSRLARGAKR